jgi:predicted amidohydrolase
LKISIIQPDIAWEDKHSNFTGIERIIIPLYNSTDLIVLPEMFNTGFSINPEKLWEYKDAETFTWMKSIARKGKFGVCGSYIVKENSHFYNRWVFVSPDGEVQYYDKRHLFSIANEDKFLSAGNSRLLFNFKGFRISPYVCYDLRFPVWSRNRKDTDLMIYAANWPESRREVWNILLKARAIENQCYVAASNRIGTDAEGIRYCGDSMIIDPKGRIIKSVNYDEEGSVTEELSLKELSEFRKKFPVQNDADDFTINL